jgi:uncharacterized protein
MEQRLSLVTLGVADLDRSRGFYERLGWRRSVKAAEGVAFFQLGCMALSLFPRRDLAKDAGLDEAGTGFTGVALGFNTRSRAEVEAVLEEAAGAGGRIVKPAQDAFWGGYHGYFADPDGHLWEVAWNAGFALARDGSLRLPD